MSLGTTSEVLRNVNLGRTPSLILEVNGTPFTNFISSEVDDSIEELAPKFNFIATVDSLSNFPIKLQDSVRVLINDKLIMTGFVEFIQISQTNVSHNIQISGRSKTMDILDSSVIGDVSFTSSVSLKAIIERLLSQNNINLNVIDNVNPKLFSFGDLLDAEPGQNMFAFINALCKKRQVFVTSDSDGNIVITRAGTDVLNQKIVNLRSSLTRILSTKNNVLNPVVTYSTEGRYNKYIVESQLNPTAINQSGSDSSSSDIVLQEGIAIDSEIRESRVLIIPSDDSNSSLTASQRAIWEANIRRARSFNYICEVQGFTLNRQTNVIWEKNKLVRVQDDKADIDAELLIKRIKYSFSGGGSITTLTMGYKDSFTLNVNQNNVDARSDKIGVNII